MSVTHLFSSKGGLSQGSLTSAGFEPAISTLKGLRGHL
jgi:hypothetical protein